MRIFINGTPERQAELSPILSDSNNIHWNQKDELPDCASLNSFDLFIDLNLDEQSENMEHYACQKGKWLIASTVKKSIADLIAVSPVAVQINVLGMNLLPTFINTAKKEVSLADESLKKEAQEILKQLEWDAEFVQDRVGMVRARILFMIINEAYYTVQEGTASKRDIDQAMKLGTNYPKGPFEWCGLIGLKNIYETLNALYEDTHEERYKICPLLKTEYLKTLQL